MRERAESRQRFTKKIDSCDNVYDSFVNRERTGVLRQNSVRTEKNIVPQSMLIAREYQMIKMEDLSKNWLFSSE